MVKSKDAYYEKKDNLFIMGTEKTEKVFELTADGSFYAKSVKNKITGATEENLEYATWYWGRFYEGFFVGTNFEKTKGNTAQRYTYAQQWLEKVK